MYFQEKKLRYSLMSESRKLVRKNIKFYIIKRHTFMILNLGNSLMLQSQEFVLTYCSDTGKEPGCGTYTLENIQMCIS